MKHRKRSQLRKQEKRRRLRIESLENRICLAASLGWDGPGQGAVSLSYYIGDVPANVGLEQAEVESAIETALDAWSSVADITFTPTTLARQSDSLDINFTSIDGSGGVLAQAYLPDDVNRGRLAGDIEFDLADPWEIGNESGRAAFDFVYVAAHEIGHALGLDHLNVVGSVLRPSVSPNQVFTSLSTADENELLELYAPASDATADPTNDSSDTTAPDADASDTNDDAAATDDDTAEDEAERRRYRGNRRGRFGGSGRARAGVEVLIAGVSHHNAHSPTDVNDDGTVSPLDALTIINDLNENGPRGLGFGEGEAGSSYSMVDVNGDAMLSALDALMVVNDLNTAEPTSIAVEDAAADPELLEDNALVDDTVIDDGPVVDDSATEQEEAPEVASETDDETTNVDNSTESDEDETEDDINELDDDEELDDNDDRDCHDSDHDKDDEEDEEEQDEEDDDTEEDEVEDGETDAEEDQGTDAEDPVPDDNDDGTTPPEDPVVMTDSGDPTVAQITAEDPSTDPTVVDEEVAADETTESEETDVTIESKDETTEEGDSTEVADTTMDDEASEIDGEDDAEDELEEDDALEEDDDDDSVIDDGGLEEEEEHCHGDRRDPFARFDANADGLLTVDEVPEMFWAHVMTGDTDADGGISPAELEAIAMEHHRRDPIAKFDANDDGVLTIDEVPERIWEKVSQADANEDGMVTVEELVAARPAEGEASARNRRLHGGHRWHRYR